MAPDKGEKTRKRLGKQYNKAYKRTVDDVDDFLDDTINRLDDLRSAATDSIDDLSKKVDELAKNKR